MEFLYVWMHHWIGLAFARAGETAKAQQQLARLRGLPEGKASGHWSTLGANILEGEIALLVGDIDTAVTLMAPTVERIHEMGGGSREQKDIFLDVFLELQRRRGDVDAVSELAQRRLQRNPNHFQSLAAIAWAYAQSGEASRQQEMCQEIIDRAAQMPVSDQAPALVEAREALHAG